MRATSPRLWRLILWCLLLFAAGALLFVTAPRSVRASAGAHIVCVSVALGGAFVASAACLLVAVGLV